MTEFLIGLGIYCAIALLIALAFTFDEWRHRGKPTHHKAMPYSLGWFVGAVWLPAIILLIIIRIRGK